VRLDIQVAPEENPTVWEATANLPPVLAAPLWAYVAGLFDAPDLRALRAAALAVGPVIPGSVMHFKEEDLVGGAVLTRSLPEAASAPAVIAAHGRLRHEHPVIDYYERAGSDGRPLAISDLADERSFAMTALYREVYSAFAARDQLVIPVPLRHGRARVALCIGRDDWGFSDAEHVAAEVIQRSLRVTYGSLWRRRSHRAAASVSTELLARSGVQVCVVDRFGVISDTAGRGTLDPLVVEAITGVGRLAGATDVRGARGSRERTGERGSVLVELKVVDTHGEPVTLQLLDTDDGEFWPVMLKRASSNVRLENLLDRGLTRRQAEVMALLLAGRTTCEAALALSISPRTAEKHIQLACVALGARTRSEALVALASGADSSRG